MNCNCGDSAVFCSLNQACEVAQQGHRPPCSATGKCLWSDGRSGPWGTASAPRRGNEPDRPAQQGHRPPEIEQQLGNLCGLLNSLDQGDLPLRNERECRRPSMDCNCGTSTVFCTFERSTCRSTTTGTSRTLSKSCTRRMNECTVGTCLCGLWLWLWLWLWLLFRTHESVCMCTTPQTCRKLLAN